MDGNYDKVPIKDFYDKNSFNTFKERLFLLLIV